jgi:Acetyltransferase (GNAT) domain
MFYAIQGAMCTLTMALRQLLMNWRNPLCCEKLDLPAIGVAKHGLIMLCGQRIPRLQLDEWKLRSLNIVLRWRTSISYWGRGYGSESLVWLQHFLRKNYGVREFWATITPGNESSKNLLLKNGYAKVTNDNLPQLTSYDENDWVFFRVIEEGHNDA